MALSEKGVMCGANTPLSCRATRVTFSLWRDLEHERFVEGADGLLAVLRGNEVGEADIVAGGAVDVYPVVSKHALSLRVPVVELAAAGLAHDRDESEVTGGDLGADLTLGEDVAGSRGASGRG